MTPREKAKRITQDPFLLHCYTHTYWTMADSDLTRHLGKVTGLKQLYTNACNLNFCYMSDYEKTKQSLGLRSIVSLLGLEPSLYHRFNTAYNRHFSDGSISINTWKSLLLHHVLSCKTEIDLFIREDTERSVEKKPEWFKINSENYYQELYSMIIHIHSGYRVPLTLCRSEKDRSEKDPREIPSDLVVLGKWRKEDGTEKLEQIITSNGTPKRLRKQKKYKVKASPLERFLDRRVREKGRNRFYDPKTEN